MKAILTGLLLGAVTSLAVNAGALSANHTRPIQAQTVVYQPAPSQAGEELIEVASTTVLAPQYVAWTPDGSAVYIVSHEAVLLFEPATGSTTMLSRLVPGEFVMDVSSTGLLAVLSDGTLTLRDARGGEVASLVQDADVSSASFAPDGATLALVLDNGSVLQTWDVASGVMLSEYTSPSLAEQAFSVSFSPSGQHLTWFSILGGQSLDLATGELGPFVAFDAGIYDVQMCTDDSLVVATNDGRITLWDTASGRLSAEDGRSPAYSASCSARGDVLLITTDSSVGMLALPDLAPLRWLAGEAVDAEFSPSGERFVVVGADGSVTVYRRA